MAYVRRAIQYNGTVSAKFDLTYNCIRDLSPDNTYQFILSVFPRYVVMFPAPLSICCLQRGSNLAISSTSFRKLPLLGWTSISIYGSSQRHVSLSKGLDYCHCSFQYFMPPLPLCLNKVHGCLLSGTFQGDSLVLSMPSYYADVWGYFHEISKPARHSSNPSILHKSAESPSVRRVCSKSKISFFFFPGKHKPAPFYLLTID